MDEFLFRRSDALTIGVELELQLVRPRDFDLSRDAADLLARLERLRLPGAVKPEITESMVELNSSVHCESEALLSELAKVRDAVVREAGMLNLRVSGGGAHPFHDWTHRRIYPTERFRFVLERYGYLAKQFTVFGQHIHVGCPDGDQAIRLAHAMTRYVPHFIALSASSPYYQGEDTSFQSSRLTAVSAFPLAGHLPLVSDWNAFTGYFSQMKSLGIVESMKDFYWDVRPKPEYGTIEIRVCDTPLDVRRAAALAAYAQAVAALHLEEPPRPPDPVLYQVNAFNRFEASRFGLRGALVDPARGDKVSLREDVAASLDRVAPFARRLGSERLLETLRGQLSGAASDADWLRARHADQGSLGDVVRDACGRWEAGTD